MDFTTRVSFIKICKQWQNYIRVIFGDDDRENEEFLDFDLDNIEEAEERYIRQ